MLGTRSQPLCRLVYITVWAILASALHAVRPWQRHQNFHINARMWHEHRPAKCTGKDMKQGEVSSTKQAKRCAEQSKAAKLARATHLWGRESLGPESEPLAVWQCEGGVEARRLLDQLHSAQLPRARGACSGLAWRASALLGSMAQVCFLNKQARRRLRCQVVTEHSRSMTGSAAPR